MRTLLTAIFLSTIGFVFADSGIPFAFEAARMEPCIVDLAPSNLIRVNYGNKNVTLANELTPAEALNNLDIHYNPESGVFYTSTMTDPEAPSRENPRDTGDTMVVYSWGSAPQSDTDLYRDIFSAYEQSGEYYCDEQQLTCNSNNLGRSHFSSEKFMAKYNAGNPIAGNPIEFIYIVIFSIFSVYFW